MPARKLRSRRHDPDVERYIATYRDGDCPSMLIYLLDCGGKLADMEIPRELLPALVDRFRDDLMPNSWAAKQLERSDA